MLVGRIVVKAPEVCRRRAFGVVVAAPSSLRTNGLPTVEVLRPLDHPHLAFDFTRHCASTGEDGRRTAHGFGESRTCLRVARRIEQVSGNEVLLNQGTIYASLVRLQQRGWIAAKWGTSDNNRKAKFYSITKTGQKQLVQDTAYWQRLAGVMGRVLAMQGEGDEQ